MKKTFVYILISLFSIGTLSSQTDCETILSKEINLTFNEKSDLDILNNTFSKLINCGLEEIDVEFFANGPILATLLIPIINENKGKVTYQNLFDKILEFKQTPKYKEAIDIFKTSNELSKRKIDLNNWSEDKKLLQKIEVLSKYCDEFYLYLKENDYSNKTYKEAWEEFAETKSKFQPKSVSENTAEFLKLLENQGNLEFQDLLNQSIKLNKPLLLYFTGYACVNSRKIEQNLLRNAEIVSKLKDDFVFVSLYVDDRSELPQKEWITDKSSGKVGKTIGSKYAKLQKDMFNTNYQPYFVILDQNGKKQKEQGYTTDIEILKDFLRTSE
ncbi:hypothetical protein GCM10007962_32510 [Yeosuana aromativorans]|uniref:Thioredoxin-like fold domain-containing protein n=1 Tax=Yeosuana aromativorans TaxID=288019 RepID=A0A8J3BP82_9FLAO|nr:thioredoxin family protein [Yeosuana aromativorans]GGK35629.1 hypothetical protein GCM10007962_32510 [Yeosuana aromativorans]